MYKLSVPIMSSTANEHNRQTYVRQCREAGAERVFLCTGSPLEPIPAALGENVAYFKAQGFEVGIWTDTIGHGFVLGHVETADIGPRFTQMVNLDGEVRHHANCPMDETFRRYIAQYIAALARTGADIVMLDDDFRMSQHGDALCCACPAHLRRIGEILGEEVTLEQIRPRVLSGKANRYRSAWMQAQNEGMVAFAEAIRAEVDRETPWVTVCCCTAFAPWNVDDTDVAKITKILAGRNHPILRLTGAPYWATKSPRNYSLISVFAIARTLASFCRDEGFDLMSEGDVYPRPRYTCPASYLELYDAVTRADGGYTGILKYMFDYVAGPEFETGYLKFHRENSPFLEAMHRLFPQGANAGVRVVVRPHTMEQADLDLSTATMHMPLPFDGTMLGSCGIPTVYSGDGVCNSVFGENARTFDLGELGKGTMLDAVSAVILTERGVDVGLADYAMPEKGKISFLCTGDPAYKSFISGGEARLLPASLKAGARPLLYSTDPTGSAVVAYAYENTDGERFLVFLFEGDSLQTHASVCGSGLMKNYATQKVLIETLPWVARRPLPASCAGNPELYLMCAKDEHSLSAALFNCFADALTQPVITLDDDYHTIECYGCEARLDGNRVTLTGRLHGFTSAAFRVYK